MTKPHSQKAVHVIFIHTSPEKFYLPFFSFYFSGEVWKYEKWKVDFLLCFWGFFFLIIINSLWYFKTCFTTFMGKTPIAWRTGRTWGAAMQTWLAVQTALMAGITSGHMCKLPMQTPAGHSPLLLQPHTCTSHWNTSVLSTSSFEGSLGAGKSPAMPANPGKSPSPCPTLADAQTTSFQTAAGTTKLCVHCTEQTNMIENWRQRLCAEDTSTSHPSCWNLYLKIEAIFSKYQPGQGFNLHYDKSRIFSASLWII